MYCTKSCHKFCFLYKDIYFINKIKKIQKNDVIYSLLTNQLKKYKTIQNVHFLRLHNFSDLVIFQMLNASLI